VRIKTRNLITEKLGLLILGTVFSLITTNDVQAVSDCASSYEHISGLYSILFSKENAHTRDTDFPETSIYITDPFGNMRQLELHVDTANFFSDDPWVPGFTVSGTYPTWSPDGDK